MTVASCSRSTTRASTDGQLLCSSSIASAFESTAVTRHPCSASQIACLPDPQARSSARPGRRRRAASLTSAVGAVAIGTEQQRYVIMLRLVADLELDTDFREERLHTQAREIGLDVEAKPVRAHVNVFVGRQKMADPSARV